MPGFMGPITLQIHVIMSTSFFIILFINTTTIPWLGHHDIYIYFLNNNGLKRRTTESWSTDVTKSLNKLFNLKILLS